MVLTFSCFAAKDYKGHFRKILTGFWNLAAFLGTTTTFCMYEADYLKQNIMLNQLAPTSNPKNEKAESSFALF